VKRDERTKKVRKILARWLAYCRRRGEAQWRGGRAFLCAGCAYDAALEAAQFGMLARRAARSPRSEKEGR
jgi:hypothetical protein